MNIIFKHLKTHVFRGLLAIIPLVLSYFVIRFLYLTIDRKVAAPIENAAGFRIPGLGILLIILLLYLVGLAASNWLGKKAFNVIEWLSRRIPLIGTVYHLGKQLAEALSLPEKQSFKRVVLVEQFKPGVWTVASSPVRSGQGLSRERIDTRFLSPRSPIRRDDAISGQRTVQGPALGRPESHEYDCLRGIIVRTGYEPPPEARHAGQGAPRGWNGFK